MVFLSLSYATVYLVYMRFRNSYDSENDTFRVEFLLVPVIGLSFLENYAFTPMEVKKKKKKHSGRINMQLEGFGPNNTLPSFHLYFKHFSLRVSPSH